MPRPDSYRLGYGQMYEMLDHDADTDLWLLNEDGTTSIAPGGDEEALAAYMDPNSWPRFICKSLTVNQLERGLGPAAALKLVNDTIESIIAPKRNLAAGKVGRLLGALTSARR